MPKISALVLEVGQEKIAVLTSEGDFLCCPLPTPAPRKGQRIMVKTPSQVRPTLWLGGLVAAACLFLALWTGWRRVDPPPPPVAFAVAIDISPSLMMQLDAGGRTVKTIPLNDDARHLLLPQVGTPIGVAVSQLVDSAADNGYLKRDAQPVILFSAWDVKANQPVEALAKQVEQALVHGVQGVHIVPLTPSVAQVNDARGKGISVNRLLILERARELGIPLSPTDLEQRGLRAGMLAAGLLSPPPTPSSSPGPVAPTTPPEPGGGSRRR